MKVLDRTTDVSQNGGSVEPATSSEQTPVEQEIRNGEAVAALLAAGIGSLALGFFTTIAEFTGGFRTGRFPGLTWDTGVGPLSGKTGYAVIVWLIAWAVLHFMLRGKDLNFRQMFLITLVLIGLGVLGTFPIFFQAFA